MENEHLILNSSELKKHNPYKVPVDYFDGLAMHVLLKIASQKSVYQSPENYFGTLPNQILQKIKESNVANELDVIAPLLNKISKQSPYTVPESYFNNAQTQIPTKVVKLSAQKIIKYIAAAVVIGFIAIGIFWLNKPKVAKIDYAAINKIDVVKSMETISDDDLLNGTYTDNDFTTISTTDITDLPLANLNLEDEIKLISDTDIAAYLNNNELDIEEKENTNS